MRITVANTAIASVNHQFAALVFRDFPTRVYGLPLSFVEGRSTLASGAADSPSAIVRDDMLVARRFTGEAAADFGA